jgi:cell division protein FtsB
VSDGHRTSTIARPRLPNGDVRPVRSGALRDLTAPIARDKQLVQQRRGRVILGLIATLIALAIGAALFVLPVKSWMHQRDDLATRTSELAVLDAANSQLQGEVDRLQTDAGIKEAAREEIDYVDQGEHRITVLPIGPAPLTLPSGWPYNLISQIIALRQAEAVNASTTTTSTP